MRSINTNSNLAKVGSKMVSYKQRRLQSGFTIVELLIVIVVIGILATLVYNSYSGVQARTRDTKRLNDLSATAVQLEFFYSDNNAYPNASQLTDTTSGGWVETNLKGFDKSALKDPKGVMVNASGSTYTYTVLPSGCTGSTGETPCTSFTLTADMEKQADVTKNSQGS